MKYKQYSQNSDDGFTLLELLVSVVIGLGAMSIALSSVLTTKNAYRADHTRTKLNQDLRSALDLIGANVRITGENLSSSFPSFLIVDGGTDSDELILRRNTRDEILKVCNSITPSSGYDIVFATGGESGCIYSDNVYNYSSWRTARLERPELSIPIYLYDIASKQGEWREYIGESDEGTALAITTATASWSNNYSNSSSAVYMLEEWRFRVRDNSLELIINNQIDNPQIVAFGVTNFQAQVIYPDGSIVTSFTNTEDWTDIESIEVSLTASDTFRAKPFERTLTGRFFPRNILSN